MKSNYCTCIFYYADVFLYLTDSNQTEHLENPTNYFNGSAIDYDGSSSSSSSSFSSSFSSDFLIYLRESVVIGHLRVVYNSAHRHPRMLKFSEKLLLTLTKTFFKTDFEVLARGRFCSRFKTKKNFKKPQKLSKNVF